jgi:regulator of protease activity HflC (stomatin/prohibitin superfamily)
VSGWFIATLVVGVIGLIGVLGMVVVADVGDGLPAAIVGGVCWLVLIGIMLFMSSATIVQTRTVGVETSFGKPIGTLSNGFHMVRPWANVEKFDTSVQTLNLTAAKDDLGDPVTVRLANQTTAQVDVSVQWNIDPNGDVIDLYKRFRSFDNVENNLVKRQLQHALNGAFAQYDPLRSINGTQDTTGKSVDELAALARTELQKAVGSGIQIGTLTIPIVHFDGATEDRLRSYQQALADTRIAEQREKTAQAQKAANDALAQGNNSPGVLYQNCLDMVERLSKEGKGLPAAFNCGSSPTSVVPVK